jgi:transcriptional regulator with XRE-family HTH domain
MMKEMFKEAGLKQRDVVRKSGLSQATVCRIALGIRKPSAEQAVRLSESCGFPLHTLRPDLWPEPKSGKAA